MFGTGNALNNLTKQYDEQSFTHFSPAPPCSWGIMGTVWVTGTVSDERTGEPLIGASLLIKGTNTGTVTDLDGSFSLTLDSSEGKEVVVSSIGYTSKTIQVSPDQTSLNIQLKEDATNLEEVVVTGLASSVKWNQIRSIVKFHQLHHGQGIYWQPK